MCAAKLICDGFVNWNTMREELYRQIPSLLTLACRIFAHIGGLYLLGYITDELCYEFEQF